MGNLRPLVVGSGGFRELTSADALVGPADPSAALGVATKQYVDNGDGLLIPKSLVDAKGDLLVGTADNTVARKAAGTLNDRFVTDPSTTDGLRWDISRSSDLDWLRDAMGCACGNSSGLLAQAAGTFAFSASVRTVQCMVGRLPNGTTINSINFWTLTAMAGSGGAGQVAVYGSNDMSSLSWSRLGSAVTITTSLTATGRKSVATSISVTADMWIRVMITITGAPATTYPALAMGLAPMTGNDKAGYLFNGTSTGTASPASTLNPAVGWNDGIFAPALVLT